MLINIGTHFQLQPGLVHVAGRHGRVLQQEQQHSNDPLLTVSKQQQIRMRQKINYKSTQPIKSVPLCLLTVQCKQTPVLYTYMYVLLGTCTHCNVQVSLLPETLKLFTLIINNVT